MLLGGLNVNPTQKCRPEKFNQVTYFDSLLF